MAEGALSLALGVSFYTLSMGERTVGQTGSAVARTTVFLSHSLVMESFSFSLDSEVRPFRADGVLGADSTLQVTIDAGGEKPEVSYRIAESPIFSAALPIRITLACVVVRLKAGIRRVRSLQ